MKTYKEHDFTAYSAWINYSNDIDFIIANQNNMAVINEEYQMYFSNAKEAIEWLNETVEEEGLIDTFYVDEYNAMQATHDSLYISER